jgi:hypothetical protein
VSSAVAVAVLTVVAHAARPLRAPVKPLGCGGRRSWLRDESCGPPRCDAGLGRANFLTTLACHLSMSNSAHGSDLHACSHPQRPAVTLSAQRTNPILDRCT